MPPKTRKKMLQKVANQGLEATPKLPNNAENKTVLVDQTNQLATLKVLRGRKVYPNQETEIKTIVSKQLFKNGIIESPRKRSKKLTSTKKLTVPRKSSECIDLLEKVNEVNEHKNLVCKGKNSPVAETQSVKSIDECKNNKKLIYKGTSPASAEKHKNLTTEKKIMLYDFKGGSDRCSRKCTPKRKPKRKKPQSPKGNTSDEVNYDVQNKRMKMEAAASVVNDIMSFQPSMNSSAQPLMDQTTLSNLSVKNETRKFFKTPMRKELIEMSLFNYIHVNKKKCVKRKRPLIRKKQNTLSCKAKENAAPNTLNNFDTSSRLPVKRIMLNNNGAQSRMCDVLTDKTCSKIPVYVYPKPANSNTDVSSAKPAQLRTIQDAAGKTESCKVASSTKSAHFQAVGAAADRMETFKAVGDKTQSCKVASSANSPLSETVGAVADKTDTFKTVADKTVSAKPAHSQAVRAAADKDKLSSSTEISNTESVQSQTVRTSADKTEFPSYKAISSAKSAQSQPVRSAADKTEIPSCADAVDTMNVGISAPRDLSAAVIVPRDFSNVTRRRGGTNFGLDFTLGETETSCKTTDRSTATNQMITLPSTKLVSSTVHVEKDTTAAPSIPIMKEAEAPRNRTEDRGYFTGPVRSFNFFGKCRHKISRRERERAVYVPAASSEEHFTLENDFGFELEDELDLSPVKRQDNKSITALPPLTSTPHTAATHKYVAPQPTSVFVKPKLKVHNTSETASHYNCSQILAGGGNYTCKSKSSALGSKTMIFAAPSHVNIPSSTARSKPTYTKAGSNTMQSSITNYMQSDREIPNASEVSFDTSLSNIEVDELAVTHTKPPRRSYERPIRNKRHVEYDDYVSPEEEEDEPPPKTLSRKLSQSKRLKRSKKQEKMFDKWVSNVSSQFEEIDSVALLVE